MKTNLRKMLGLSVLCLTMFSNALPTRAGSVGTHDVVVRISPAPAYAYGSMVAARYSADNQQFIGCYIDVKVSDLSSFGTVSCAARDSAGRYIICSGGAGAVGTATSVELIQGMTASSDVYFEREPSRGLCRNIIIYNGSTMLR